MPTDQLEPSTLSSMLMIEPHSSAPVLSASRPFAQTRFGCEMFRAITHSVGDDWQVRLEQSSTLLDPNEFAISPLK